VEVNLTLADGRSLVGTVPGVSGDLLRAVTYSRLAPKHRLAAWVRLLALTAAYPERRFIAATVGRGPRGSVTVARATTMPDQALAHLAALVELYDRGMREPLPLYCQTSAAYAEALSLGREPVAAGRTAWESSYTIDREDQEPEHLLVLGGVRTFEQVLATGAEDDDVGDGDAGAEATRFGRLARRLWDGLLSSEERDTR
jgi:exodeoxyribonuclease V gamma subunit